LPQSLAGLSESFLAVHCVNDAHVVVGVLLVACAVARQPPAAAVKPPSRSYWMITPLRDSLRDVL
jgi:hypothetical protein